MTQGDIDSPTVLLTGPTSGIGARMLESLLAHPSRPRLLLLARDDAALVRAVESARAHGLEAHGIHADLSDLDSVRAALEQLASASNGSGAIDVALLNAGAQFASRRAVGAQGHELTFTVDVIAQHLLLRGLEPLLGPAAHALVMGSSTHRGRRASFNLVPDPEWREPGDLATPDPSGIPSSRDRERGGVAYASSKLALVTLAHEWAARFSRSGRRLNVYDPGLVPGTGLGRDLPPAMFWVWKHVMPAMRVLPGASSAAVSGRCAVELAMGDRFPALNDGYVEIARLTRAEPVTELADRREALWQWLETEVGPFLPRAVPLE